MEVKILNPEVLKSLSHNHGVFACTCYNTPEKYADRVGKSCGENGHMSGSRCEYIKFRLTNIDRGTAEQCMRHEIGVSVPFEEMDNYSFADYSELVVDVSPDQIVKNMGSFRYIDKDGFTYTTPREIEDNRRAKLEYDTLMTSIDNIRGRIQQTLEDGGVDKRRAVECANFVLPRATENTLTIGFTPEALIHFMHKRLCTRAQPEIRKQAIAMKMAVAEINPEFAKELVPHCDHLLWCPEGNMSCGRRPTKKQLNEFIGELDYRIGVDAESVNK